MGKCGSDDIHHKDARQDEIDIRDPSDEVNTAPHDLAEDKNIKERRNPRRYQGLSRNAEHPFNIAPNKRIQSDPIYHDSPCVISKYRFSRLFPSFTNSLLSPIATIFPRLIIAIRLESISTSS